ncbi:MAG: putative dehydrogenase/NAD(P)H nitroreductase [Anaerocolumna sp.]|nr:putative dehydrogenase/NAD(P)H nitroreductase [Anaerocolumna sp.]
MSEVLKNIKARRSVRKFSEEQIPQEKLEDILTAGLYAPSGRNSQNWQLTVVQGEEKLELLRAAVGKALGQPDYKRFYDAPTLILVSTPKDYTLGAFDSSLVLENIFLEATDLGIGSVWIHQLAGLSDNPDLREALTQLKVPEDHVTWGSAALGFPAVEVPGDRVNKGVVVYS